MNNAFKDLSVSLERLMLNRNISTGEIISFISHWVNENNKAMSEPVKDSLENTWQLPYENLLVSVLIEQILILAAHIIMFSDLKNDELSTLAEQCTWRIEILRNLLKRHYDEQVK